MEEAKYWAMVKYKKSDYLEAIEKLKDAMIQHDHMTHCCTICHDTGHLADGCHHNPLIHTEAFFAPMYRCFHCGGIFVYEAAEDHFGLTESDKPLCMKDHQTKITELEKKLEKCREVVELGAILRGNLGTDEGKVTSVMELSEKLKKEMGWE